jgi:hypothetical protein
MKSMAKLRVDLLWIGVMRPAKRRAVVEKETAIQEVSAVAEYETLSPKLFLWTQRGVRGPDEIRNWLGR